MSSYGEYAARVIHNQRAKEFQAEARRDSLARSAKSQARASGRGARSSAKARAKTA